MENEILKDIYKKTEENFQKTIDWFKREVSGLRGSRISIELFENIKVNCYNSSMRLKEIASLSSLDSKTIAIEPWDKSLIPNIEKCLVSSNLGGSIKNEGKRVLFSMPLISQEEKEKVIKLLRQKIEEAKESLRRVRDEAWKKIQDLQREGEITEDEKFQGKERLQELIDNAEGEIEKIGKAKEEEILL